MRRALFDTVSVVIGSGKVVDREGFLSAVYAASIGSITGSPTAAKLTVKVEHCDTKDGTFEVVPDSKLDPDTTTSDGILKEISVNLDLVGCKRYIKITPTISFTGGTSPAASGAAYALVLGDLAQAPV